MPPRPQSFSFLFMIRVCTILFVLRKVVTTVKILTETDNLELTIYSSEAHRRWDRAIFKYCTQIFSN